MGANVSFVPLPPRKWTSSFFFFAGVIHGDFEKGFIRAETIAYEDLRREGSEKKVKEVGPVHPPPPVSSCELQLRSTVTTVTQAGLMRSEGKEYEVKDGDVMLFRFNV